MIASFSCQVMAASRLVTLLVSGAFSAMGGEPPWSLPALAIDSGGESLPARAGDGIDKAHVNAVSTSAPRAACGLLVVMRTSFPGKTGSMAQHSVALREHSAARNVGVHRCFGESPS